MLDYQAVRRRLHPHRRRPGGGRATAAVVACLVWLVGVELLPGAHLASHGHLGAHDHGHRHGAPAASDALVVRVHTDAARAVHSHEGVLHRHDDRPIGGGDLTGSHAEGAPPAAPGHGDHSLAHRALALATPPPALLHPLPVDRQVRPVTHQVARLTASAPPPAPAARGPPPVA